MSTPLLAIGEVARRSGKAASTIRYYERCGLLAEAERVGGKRRYHADVLRTLAVIETAQRAGLALDEIRLLLEAPSNDARAAERLREIAERRLPPLRESIARAQLVHEWLEAAADCRCPSLDDCPLFDQPPLLPAGRLALR